MNIPPFLARHRARRAYWRADKLAASYARDLYTTADPAARAELLDRYADTEQSMARRHIAAFGPDPLEDEGGRDLAESIASSADLLQMLADTERALDEGLPNPDVFRRQGSTEAEVDSWMLLCQTHDRADRAAILGLLYGQAAKRVGGQAAEVLAVHTHTERELADAQAEGRKPRAPMAMPPRWVAAITFFAAGLLIVHGLFPHWEIR